MMVSKQVIKVIIEAEETISKVAKQAEKAIQQMGLKGKSGMEHINQASKTAQQTMQKMQKYVSTARNKFDELRKSGTNAFDKIKQKVGNTVNSIGKITNVSKTASQSMEKIKGVSDSIKNKFAEVKNSISSFGSSSQKTFSEIGNSGQKSSSTLQRIGSTAGNVKNKIVSLGGTVKSSITSAFGGAVTNAKGKLNNLGGAIDKIKAKLQQLKASSNSAGSGLGFLSSAASMTAGMIGYDLVNAFTQSARANINAQANIDAFGKRLGMSASEVTKFKGNMDNLQETFRKVDMDAVGASALEMGVKLGMSKNEMVDLTRTTAVMSSAFVKEGRTQEDAILAVSDAMDGQFRRLQELGISQDALKNNGWDGDLQNKTGLLKAMNKTLKDMGFEDTAAQVKTLDDAYAVLSVEGGKLLGDILVPMTPALIAIVDAISNVIQFVKDNSWAQGALLIGGLAIGFGLLAGALYAASLAEGGMMALMPGFITSLYGAASGFMAISVAGTPLWAIVAVVAAIAFAVYELGIQFGWWTDVSSMLATISNGVTRLWNAFINHPDVQALLKSIGDAWNWVVSGITWAWNALMDFFGVSTGGEWDIIRSIIDGIGLAWEAIKFPIQSVIFIIQWLWSVWDGFFSGTLSPLGGWLSSVFTPVWQLLGQILNAIGPYVSALSNAFSQFMNGQMDLPGLVSSILWNLWNAYTTILGMISRAVLSWAGKLFSQGVNAAIKFVNGIINKIVSLPGRFAVYLLQVVGRIISAGASWVSAGVSKASAMVNGVINNVSQLPGRVYSEFMNIGSRIMSAGSDLVNKAKQIGQNIVNGLLNAMGIHSPGIIQEKVVGEFKDMVGKIKDWIAPAGDAAKEMGETIVGEFGDPTLSTNTDSLVQELGTASNANINVGLDSTALTTANQDVITQYDNLANTTGLSLQDMVSQDKNAFETIRANDTAQMSNISNTVGSNMRKMTNSVRTNMNSIVAKNKSGLQSAKNNTTIQLNSMVNKTKTANQKMIDSWGFMKDGIVKAADKIRSDSTNHFNKLGTTIGTFYGKLRNPSRWGAGSPGISSRGTSTRGFSKITNAIRNASLPSALTLGQVRSNTLIDSSNFGDYILRDPKTNKFNLSDLIQYGIIDLGKGAGAYDKIPSPNIQKIKDTSKEWDMKGPLVGRYSTSKGFKVKEFLTGVPRITYDVFRSIAEEVFGQTKYEFYYDNDHHGDWVNAFNAGSMNCLHGAEALIALAHTMGLSGHLVHGHWNQYGHYFANIAGHKMDVTGWQQRRTWTPSASAGPAPKNTTASTTSDDVELKGKVTVEHIHKFIDLPDNVSAEEVARLINEAPEDDNWLLKLIKLLVKDKDFQKLDLKEKLRIERKANRAKGV